MGTHTTRRCFSRGVAWISGSQGGGSTDQDGMTYTHAEPTGATPAGLRGDKLSRAEARTTARAIVETMESRRLMSTAAVLSFMLPPQPPTAPVSASPAGPSRVDERQITRFRSPLQSGPAVQTATVTTKSGGGTTQFAGIVPVTTRATVTASLAPVARIAAPYGTSISVLNGLHVNALGSVLSVGTPLAARYVWDFGDTTVGSAYNRYEGFNAAHVYNVAGTYTVTLTVTDESGAVGTTKMSVTVRPDTRRAVYVSRAGNDANDGSSPDRPVATPARALTLTGGSNTTVLLRRGDLWDLTGAIQIAGDNVVVGAYGTGANPVLRRASGSLGELVSVAATADHVTIQDLAFDSNTPTLVDKTSAARGIRAAGRNLVVRNNSFTNVTDAVNGELSPDGVLVQDNTAPGDTSVRGYFSWVQGDDWVFLGNRAGNSTREHIIRVGGAVRLNAQFNHFGNIDRRSTDAKDIAKGVFTVQIVDYAYIANNTMPSGPSGVGPLGGLDGRNSPDARARWVVFRANTINGANLNLSPGIEDVLVEDNVITMNGATAINVTATDPTTDPATGLPLYSARNIYDLFIRNNTGFNNSVNGRFLTLNNASVPGQITLTNNLYVAPKLETGYNQNAAVYVAAANLGSFRTITGNIWPVPAKTPGGGGVMYVWPNWWDSRGYVNPATWNLQTTVGDDVFSNVNMTPPGTAATAGTTPSATFQATVGTTTAGARLRR